MRYGIFSDVHSNLEALTQVLDALQKEKIDRYLFIGDLVGYGADPKACLELFRHFTQERPCLCVAGNHDYAVCHKTLHDHYDRNAQAAIEWTRGQLSLEEKEYLSQMKLVNETDHLTLVHGSLEAPSDWKYLLDIDDAYPSFKLMEKNICFVGHSHKPIVFTAGELIDWVVKEKIVIQKDKKYIINVGSVGQPRDGNPKASFAVYDTEASTVRIKRVEYDVRQAQQKIFRAGLPVILAKRLSLGK